MKLKYQKQKGLKKLMREKRKKFIDDKNLHLH